MSLGTFCVDQPTTSRILALTSTGTATIALSASALAAADSPFDLALVAPLGYPGVVAPHQRATVAVTPKRRGAAGTVTDGVVWTTDVADAAMSRTALTAAFVSDGGAIAPGALQFGPTAILVDTHNAQQITLQNCSTAALQLDTPQIPAPFSLEGTTFPAAINPGELATFSVAFHPTKLGPVTKKLSITSPQLHDPLTVELSGEGVAGNGGNVGTPDAGTATTSFYACGGCTAGGSSSALAITLAALGILVPRRRRHTG